MTDSAPLFRVPTPVADARAASADAPSSVPGASPSIGGVRYRLDPDVALRAEPFGALAYHYGSRRLTFLRSTLLADMVRTLGDYSTVDDALAERVPEAKRPAYRRALSDLAASHFIRPEAPASSAQSDGAAHPDEAVHSHESAYSHEADERKTPRPRVASVD